MFKYNIITTIKHVRLQKMNKKIDVNEIIKELDEKIKKGLAEKSLTVTDISIMLGEHLEKAKEKIINDAGEIIGENKCLISENNCKECGGILKKTKK